MNPALPALDYLNHSHRPAGRFPLPQSEMLLGTITDWALSQPFKYNRVDLDEYPMREELASVRWQKAAWEPNGLVRVARYVKENPVIP